MLLEKILEEDSTCSFGDDYSRREHSLSPNSNDKKYLLEPSSHHMSHNSSTHHHQHHHSSSSSSHHHNGHALHMTNI